MTIVPEHSGADKDAAQAADQIEGRPMTTGVVKFFNQGRGYGFIQPDDGGPDVFIHISALESVYGRDEGVLRCRNGSAQGQDQCAER
jgi:hypothetical protein